MNTSRRQFLCAALAAPALLSSRVSWAETAPTLRLGLLAGGTASWEVETLMTSMPSTVDATKALGLTLELTPLASPQAGKIALLGGSVDMIVSDWLWAARSHQEQAPLHFLPYSSALGALVVRAEGSIRSVADLAGCRIGVAGGALDKSWLILKTAAQRQGLDLEKQATVVFAAPPLLSAQMAEGALDAVLTFWPYVVRLQAQGCRVVKDVPQLMADVSGNRVPVPWLGYVVRQEWSRAHLLPLKRFYQAIVEARCRLRDDDQAWQPLAKTMAAENDAVAIGLRQTWRAGIPAPWGEAERQACQHDFAVLREVGGEALTGSVTALDAGLFAPVSLSTDSRVTWQD